MNIQFRVLFFSLSILHSNIYLFANKYNIISDVQDVFSQGKKVWLFSSKSKKKKKKRRNMEAAHAESHNFISKAAFPIDHF